MMDCHSMIENMPARPYHDAIEILIAEHPGLRAQMENIYIKSKLIYTGDTNNLSDKLSELNNMLVNFITDIEPHADKEEGALFEALAKLIGREGGPISVMEAEHNTAKKLMRRFQANYGEWINSIDGEKAKLLSGDLMETMNILFDHFTKEEEILFPLAENLLTKKEKDALIPIMASY
jgi:hemerythrin-like domain-containing protein